MGIRILYVIQEEDKQGTVQGLNNSLIRYSRKTTNNSLFKVLAIPI